MTAGDREFGIVLLGPTGITGRVAAAYLAERASEVGVRWAVAGRDAARMAAALDDAGVRRHPEIIEADVLDAGAMLRLAGRTRVVVNLVGPYSRLGRHVVDACVARGASYCDLTGEPQFVATSDVARHDLARTAGVALVHTAGFEALPPDLLVGWAAERARARGSRLVAADVVTSIHGELGAQAVSGGTAQSLVAALGLRRAPEVADAFWRAAIVQQQLGGPPTGVRGMRLAPRRRAGRMLAPTVPAPFLDPPVIFRSAALRADAYGEAFSPFGFTESIDVGRAGPATLAAASAIAVALTMMRGLGGAPFVVRYVASRVLGRILPQSGTGPTGVAMDRIRWSARLTACGADGVIDRLAVDAVGHPGYSSTSRMIAELGLILAAGPPPATGSVTGSLIVPADRLHRFAHAGLVFHEGHEIVDPLTE